MKPFRSRRVGELIKRELAQHLNSAAIGDSNSFITVTEVCTSPDMRYADVWVSIYGEKQRRSDALKKLQENAWKLRHEMAKRIYLRRMPELRFRLDETLDRAEKINNILENIELTEERVLQDDKDEELQKPASE